MQLLERTARYNVVHCKGETLNCNLKDIVLYLWVGGWGGEDFSEFPKSDSNFMFRFN
jgi:hypothetical protein